MRLWSFIFMQQDAALQSARVVAPTIAIATALMGDLLKLQFAASTSPYPGVMLKYAGEVDTDEPKILYLVARDGEIYEAVRT